jgi:hypothetical protein
MEKSVPTNRLRDGDEEVVGVFVHRRKGLTHNRSYNKAGHNMSVQYAYTHNKNVGTRLRVPAYRIKGNLKTFLTKATILYYGSFRWMCSSLIVIFLKDVMKKQ